MSVDLEKDEGERVDCFGTQTLDQLTSQSSSHSATSVIPSKPITTMIAVTTASLRSVRFAASIRPPPLCCEPLARAFLIQSTVRLFNGATSRTISLKIGVLMVGN